MKRTAVLSIFSCLLLSCGQRTFQKSDKPITLGDSATIVTETDSQYLKDNIPELQLAIAADEEKQEDKTTDKDTAPKPAETAPPKSAEIKGFPIDIGQNEIVFTGIDAKEFRKQDPVHSNGISYAVTSGDIRSAKIVITGNAKNVTVQQRYQSALEISTSLGKLELEKLGYYTSSWGKLNGRSENGNAVFAITGLNAPGFVAVSKTKIRNATEQTLRAKRTSSATTRKWLSAIRNVSSSNDKACNKIIKNVQWIIEGTDAIGKNFRKTVRMDL